MLAPLLGFITGTLVVILVLNLTIKVRQARLAPNVSEPDGMFRQTTRGFGGADFIAAVVVMVVSMIGAGTAVLASLPASRPRDLAPSAFAFNWPVVVPAMLVALALNWVTIRKRHGALLDWPSAGVAAALILSGFLLLWYMVFSGFRSH
jgi:hypothetical protein